MAFQLYIVDRKIEEEYIVEDCSGICQLFVTLPVVPLVLSFVTNLRACLGLNPRPQFHNTLMYD